MTFLEMLHRRRSCRKFRPEPIPQHMIDEMIKAVLTAPSSKNTRSTRLTVIRDRGIIEQLSRARTYGSAFVKDAPLVVLVMADPAAGGLLVENSTISATYLQLAAESLGLGSCWAHISAPPHDDAQPDGTTAEEYIHSVVPATAPYRIECMVAMGFPAADAPPRKEHDDSDKVIVIG